MFVGCPADGQLGYIDPPDGAPKMVTLPDTLASQIAFYKAENSPGVFAPRGWHCKVTYGSNGSSLRVTPKALDTTDLRSATIRRPVVELEFEVGGTSGRFSVAAYASRLFPKTAAAFIERVKKEGLEPVSDFERGPYPHDSVRYPDSLVAEFITPPETNGLGTGVVLLPSRDTVRGIVVLDDADPDEPNITILRVRIPPNMHRVADTILRLNRECVVTHEGC